MLQVTAAVFVKSPGLSPVKTRLATHLGVEAATDFYLLSCAAVEEVLQLTPNLGEAVWALAEAEADHLSWWKNFRTVRQGTGSLGERLHQVYSSLTEEGRGVLLLGADAPQISPNLIEEAIERVRAGGFVVGPALDGGFYLFGGSQPIPAEVWTQVQYSQSDTLSRLCAGLGQQDSLSFLPVLRDVDEWEDLLALRAAWRLETQLLPAQLRLQQWSERF